MSMGNAPLQDLCKDSRSNSARGLGLLQASPKEFWGGNCSFTAAIAHALLSKPLSLLHRHAYSISPIICAYGLTSAVWLFGSTQATNPGVSGQGVRGSGA